MKMTHLSKLVQAFQLAATPVIPAGRLNSWLYLRTHRGVESVHRGRL